MTSSRRKANAIRALAMDAVQKANSGHPGAPLGMADIAEVLFTGHLKHNPANPGWWDRDRFVLSGGHASMLLYACLHLCGYDISMKDIMDFRQFGARTPGHPEYGRTPGVETTTGPLGQGLANAVGMALAERMLACSYNRPDFPVVDHFTYVFAGDGCLMEGISHEACSLAGTLGLGKLIVVWDDNTISIDGHTRGWFSEDTADRFEAYGWHVIAGVDGHDAQAIDEAFRQARERSDKPTLICCRTVIGFGAPNVCGSHDCHGSPLGEAEIAAARAELNWGHEPFDIPGDVRQAWHGVARGRQAENDWLELYAGYAKAHPDLAAEFSRRMKSMRPDGFDETAWRFIGSVQDEHQDIATRKASQNAINAFAPLLPEMAGGSADLTPSNLTNWKGCVTINPGGFEGNYISYGVREFGMAAIMNGMALHGGFIPFGGTFLVFSDYSRNALRMAAMMGIRTIHVLTHDSIGVGEDGPTHQPIEHVASLRLIPGMSLWRPCDAAETAVAWKNALCGAKGPTCLILSRQNLPAQRRTDKQLRDVERGGYVLKDCHGHPDVVFAATGSEVATVMEAAEILAGEGVKARVVSMPCLNLFDAQPQSYRAKVLPEDVLKVSAEAGATAGWWRHVGMDGLAIGIDSFGESAPAPVLFKHFGLTGPAVAEKTREALARRRKNAAGAASARTAGRGAHSGEERPQASPPPTRIQPEHKENACPRASASTVSGASGAI
jgi:transketolase